MEGEPPRAWSLTEMIVRVFEMVLDRKTSQAITQEDLEREFLTAESRVKELRKQAHAAASALGPYSRASVEQLVAVLLEAAKGVVGYGGLGRELGHTTQDQFFAMRSALLGFVRFAATLPKPRKPRLTKQLPANLGASKQTSLNLELDCATVLLTVIPHEPAQAIA